MSLATPVPVSMDAGTFERTCARERARHAGKTIAIPLRVGLLGDQLTPVLAYRRLVVGDERLEPSFLFESVENGDRQGRYSILGARPAVEVVAREHAVRVTDRRGVRTVVGESREGDPLLVMRRLTADVVQAELGMGAMPVCLLGGWVGFAGYDTVRYAEADKMSFASAPRDDRGLADLHFGLYDSVVVFDHVDKVVHAVVLAMVGAGDEARVMYERAAARLKALVDALQVHSKPLASGLVVDAREGARAPVSNMKRGDHAAMVERAREYIRAGDIFQVVVGQRFERESKVDPFDVYRALRVVNPSPYMVYLQAPGCILVASSPEILCRVRRGGDGSMVITSRPLAGTRRRGSDAAEDGALERELLADPKERAEHIMLVDLGRNDVGRVADLGSVRTPALMQIERYSHVMHISSTVTGAVRSGLDCWDALRSSLPVGTISGAPKIRAMQIIDELEPVRRGPYGGGFGYATLTGEMDMALALRTMVVPTAMRRDGAWTYHLQAAGGIVFDSDAGAEFDETVNKAAALERAIDLAERAFEGGH